MKSSLDPLQQLATLSDDDLEAVIAELGEDGLESLERAMRDKQLIARAREFSEDGFAAFYEHQYKRPLPNHARKDWIPTLFTAYKSGKGIVAEAFRGSTKSTTLTICFTAYFIGHHPYSSNLLIQVGDDIASDNTQDIANIIQHSPAWKDVFPNVVPDESHWATSGYFVKLADEPYSVFTQKRAAVTKDPTFIGLGYKSRAIIGKHPTGLLIVDDIHDENNTASERELRKVKTILTGTIFPAAKTAKIQVFIGTPWAESDVLHYCLATGEFDHTKTTAEVNGEPVWPEEFSAERLAAERRKAGEIEYARMYLLDLSKTKGLVLKATDLDTFDHTAIQEYWDTYIGIDYTSTADPRRTDVDYFALAVGKMIPGLNKLVIVDGIRQRITQADAETAVVSKALEYPRLIQLGVEAIITGDEFLKVLMRSELLKNGIVPIGLRGGPFQKKKGYRYEKIMQPAFQRKQVLLSDAENSFLHHFRDEWMNWQGDALERQYHNDTLDAVFNVVYMALPNFARRIGELEGQITNPMWAKQRSRNPFARLNEGK